LFCLISYALDFFIVSVEIIVLGDYNICRENIDSYWRDREERVWKRNAKLSESQSQPSAPLNPNSASGSDPCQCAASDAALANNNENLGDEEGNEADGDELDVDDENGSQLTIGAQEGISDDAIQCSGGGDGSQANVTAAKREGRSKAFKDTLMWNEARRREREWLTGTFFGMGECAKEMSEKQSFVDSSVLEAADEKRQQQTESLALRGDGLAFVDTFRHFYPHVAKYSWWDPVTFSRAQNMGMRR
jgi:hypothetical protein